MPVIEFKPKDAYKKDLRDAIDYVKDDPGGALSWVKWLVGFVTALVKKRQV